MKKLKPWMSEGTGPRSHMQLVIKPGQEPGSPDSLSSITHCFLSPLSPRFSAQLPTKCPHWISVYWIIWLLGAAGNLGGGEGGRGRRENLELEGQDIFSCRANRDIVSSPWHTLPYSLKGSAEGSYEKESWRDGGGLPG